MTHNSQSEGNVDVLNGLQTDWCNRGLAKLEDDHVSFKPTFIEEVGKASAETVRAAALVRLFKAKPQILRNWLKEVLPDLAIPDNEPLIVTREFPLGPGSRVDIAIQGKDGKKIAFVEVKWLARTEDDQLIRYLECIDEGHVGARLIILSPIAHVWSIDKKRKEPQRTQEVGISTWAQLWEAMEEERVSKPADRTSIEYDICLTTERLSLFQIAIRRAVMSNARLEEVFAIDKWLKDATPLDDSYRALLRMTLVTELAELLVKRRSNDSAWRSLTAAGPQNDWQADVSFGGETSYVTVPSTNQYMMLFTRFHLYKDASYLRVVAGSELRPYLDGKKKKDWENGKSNEINSVFSSLGRLREALIKKLRDENLAAGGNPRTKQWFKGFPQGKSVKFDREATFEDVLDHAQSISNAVIGAFEEFS